MGRKGCKKKARKRQGKCLHPDVLRRVRGEVLSYEARVLQRAESMDSIRFPKRVNHPDDLLVRVPKKVSMFMAVIFIFPFGS